MSALQLRSHVEAVGLTPIERYDLIPVLIHQLDDAGACRRPAAAQRVHGADRSWHRDQDDGYGSRRSVRAERPPIVDRGQRVSRP